ncbi:hypothetical protein EON66_01735 [archaeon]|nr:MAG: hypothetical protein EON66_01735 [archaeon]
MSEDCAAAGTPYEHGSVASRGTQSALSAAVTSSHLPPEAASQHGAAGEWTEHVFNKHEERSACAGLSLTSAAPARSPTQWARLTPLGAEVRQPAASPPKSPLGVSCSVTNESSDHALLTRLPSSTAAPVPSLVECTWGDAASLSRRTVRFSQDTTQAPVDNGGTALP